jgi:molybdate transport system substrate-binding protein
MTLRSALLFTACIMAGAMRPASAAETTLLAARVLRPILSELAPMFEASTGHKLVIVYDTAGAITKRVARGEPADVVITQKPDVERLAAEGRIQRDSVVPIARSGVAVGVPKGATKPDIASAAAVKQALLTAHTVAYPDGAIGNASGVQFRRMIGQLGVTEKVDAKAKVWQKPFVEWATDNEAALVFTQPTDILGAPRFELVGWLPDELQDYDAFTWTAGIAVGAAHTEGARALVKLLTSSAASEIIVRRGMKP